jgi:hypothetical protein
VQCSTCGAHNPDGAITCAVCGEAPFAEVEFRGNGYSWIAAMPLWLRWFIALPCVAILAAMAIRRLVYTGFDDVTSGIIFPAAIAVVMFGAAQIAAHFAPSYKKQVGLAIVFSELAVFCAVFFNSVIFSMEEAHDPARVASLNYRDARSCHGGVPRPLYRERGGSNDAGGGRPARKCAPSIPDTPNGKCSLFLAAALTIKSQPAVGKVVEPRTGRIVFRCRPVESMGFQPCILAILGAAATEHGVEPRAASFQERLVGRFTAVGRILTEPTVAPGHLPPFVVRR